MYCIPLGYYYIAWKQETIFAKMSLIRVDEWKSVDPIMRFENFKELADTDEMSMIFQHRTGAKPMYIAYCGLGHHSIIFFLGDKYQCLLVGGSNSYDVVANLVSFYLYQFDQMHVGEKIGNLKPDSEIVVYSINNSKLLSNYIANNLRALFDKYSESIVNQSVESYREHIEELLFQ